MDAWGDDPSIGCMCAQGQVLHLVGGRSAEDLSALQQFKADGEVAAILNISRAHSVLLRNINDKADGAPSIVLRDPAKALGDQWSKLLDFWWMLDQFNGAEWSNVTAARAAAWDAAWEAAREAAREAAWEIQGFELLGQRGRDVFFLPMFGIKTLADIPARPDDYGLGFVPAGDR